MPLEQEVIGLLIAGFSIVMGIALIVTLFLWIKNKHNSFGYIWTLLHFFSLIISVYFALQAIGFDYNHPMASEEISFRIGIAGVAWAVSMFCLIIALIGFSRNRK
ncbi:hypothetical protein [Gracilibacillus salinarum]|uniref:Uncharacterized protein n=1 Tax=Gracilibacillus salinarum TaxID=2932255 RepID=A0ABY4GRB2_9BACI|nr:hypothetical protein [Gracilibacillus salinarum]UOQ86905.1 hypothetical protein MUN87_08485 [Gracilibacillus salinarum]